MEEIILFGEHNYYIETLIVMFPLLRACFGPVLYPGSGIEIQNGAQLFP